MMAKNCFYPDLLTAKHEILVALGRGMRHRTSRFARGDPAIIREIVMKVRNSLKSLRLRHRDNQLVRRRGRVYIINKTQKRYKARQG